MPGGRVTPVRGFPPQRSLGTWPAQSAQLAITSVVAQNHALHLVAFQWLDSFRSRVSPIRCTKRWDGADLTPNHRSTVSDRHHPNTWCGSCTKILTAGHLSAPKFGSALLFGAGSAPLGLLLQAGNDCAVPDAILDDRRTSGS